MVLHIRIPFSDNNIKKYSSLKNKREKKVFYFSELGVYEFLAKLIKTSTCLNEKNLFWVSVELATITYV